MENAKNTNDINVGQQDEDVYTPEPLEVDLDSLMDEVEETPTETSLPEGHVDSSEEQASGPKPSQSALAKYVTERIGSDSVKVNVGDKSLVRNVNELSEAQLVKLMDHVNRSNASETPEISEDEMTLIQNLREGGWDYIRKQIEQVAPEEVTDDQLIIDYLYSGLGDDITDEQIQEGVENFKNDPLYEKRISNLRERYDEYTQQQKQQQINQKIQKDAELYQQLGQTVLKDGFLNFEFEDQEGQETVGQAYSWLTEVNENGTTPFDEYVSDPENRFSTAMVIATLPKLQNYVAQLHDRISELESGNTVVKTKANPTAEMEEDFDKMFPDISLKRAD